MALLDDLFSGWGTTVLVGVGVALVAPALLPAVGAVIRPVASHGAQGVVDVVQQVGGSVGSLAQAAVAGVMESVDTLGTSAVKTVTNVLVTAVDGVKTVVNAALPQPR